MTTVTAAADTADQPDNHKPLHCMIDPGLWKVLQKVLKKYKKTFVTIFLSNLKLGLPNMLEVFWQMDPFPSFNQYTE